jgi:tRNA threonylcarbamoyl adenosine modification protein YeaZ
MKILALDTSTSRVSVAIVEDTVVIADTHAGELVGAQFHGELLAGLIRDICVGNSIDAIAVGRGPGPYTGLRVGITTGDVLAAAWGIPVVGVSTLHALAHGHIRRGGKAGSAVLDVKRKEIAVQKFADDASLIGEPFLISIADIASLENDHVVGPAFVTQTNVSPNVADSSPVDAVDIALIAQSEIARGVFSSSLPLYLRAPDAAEPAPRKAVLG